MARLTRKACKARKRIAEELEFLIRELRDIDSWRASMISGLNGAIGDLLRMQARPEFRLYLAERTNAEVLGWLGDNPPVPRSMVATPLVPPPPTIDELLESLAEKRKSGK